MKKQPHLLLAAAAGLLLLAACGSETTVFTTAVFVPEEGGLRFEKITDDADNVSDYEGTLAYTDYNRKLQWWVLPQLAVSPDGKRIAYVNLKNSSCNVMVKSTVSGGGSTQRTFRSGVRGVDWSADGKSLCFTEKRNNQHTVNLTNAEQGAVVRQISNSSANDYGGVQSPDGKMIMFHRAEGAAGFSLWSYDTQSNIFSNYSRGMTACFTPESQNLIYCCRKTNRGDSEIWRINIETGMEELILSQPDKSYSTPRVSPDGKWLLVTGTSYAAKERVTNTDIFCVRTDGSQLTQLTYHPGHDLSAVWSPDGKSIYFLSQRGSADRKFNVLRMNFNL